MYLLVSVFVCILCGRTLSCHDVCVGSLCVLFVFIFLNDSSVRLTPSAQVYLGPLEFSSQEYVCVFE